MSDVIALVDDDKNILTSVSIALETEGYVVHTYSDGASALKAILSDPPSLVVLDIKMPRMNGLEMLAKLRQKLSVPVIFLTSKSDEDDEIIGLEMGADDYITKPFSQSLLITRIKSLLRRQATCAVNPDSSEILTCGVLKLNPQSYSVTINDKAVNLTVSEFLLLSDLVKNHDIVRSREQLVESAYGNSAYSDARTIDSHIKRLRKKIREIDDSFDNIETIYGVGYKYQG